MLLGSEYMDALEGLMDLYVHAVRRCLEGAVEPNADKEDPQVGVKDTEGL